jgi:hypothetical protein
MSKTPKRKLDKEMDDLREENEMHDLMLSALVDVLEEKGILGHDEWEKRIKQRLSSK